MIFFDEKVNGLLAEMEKQKANYWNVSREIGQLLYSMLRLAKAKRVLEIGTSNGYSGIWMARALSNVNGMLVTVESHAERFDLASQNFKLAGIDKWVTQVKGHAPEIFASDEEIKRGEFDLVFLDATKKQHIDFLQGVFPLVRRGGMIVVDNVLSHWEVMSQLVEYVQKRKSLSNQLIEIGSGMLFLVKEEDVL